ncbi:MAG: tRNA (guanosine(46)-N7)-methyltransferase TrmB [Phycisphaeraceae bacterium]|nr:tRNA (guanosine(46)-N7)-methyltransferase TrmB [Phycisphaerales bacterium]MCB9859263.1 tRNA (guanosine(46)-N7)-methyltransferase TrmB [Phycisphaeraceae bacterium]
MSFGLGHGRQLDATGIAIGEDELPPLPDEIATDPLAGVIDPCAWFSNPAQPLEIEIGSGKGTFILQYASQHPEVNLLGIEIAGEFCTYAADRIRRAQLSDVRMLRADATSFLRWRVPTECVRTVHLYFSDPWPKSRHHKNRVVQDRFLADVHRVLVPSGDLRIVTDHDDYWQWMEAHADRWCISPPEPWQDRVYVREEFKPADGAGDNELVGTNFERKYKREGRPFHAMVLRKR